MEGSFDKVSEVLERDKMQYRFNNIHSIKTEEGYIFPVRVGSYLCSLNPSTVIALFLFTSKMPLFSTLQTRPLSCSERSFNWPATERIPVSLDNITGLKQLLLHLVKAL